MRKIPDAAEGNRTETGKKRIKRRTVTVCGCVLLCILLECIAAQRTIVLSRITVIRRILSVRA